MTVMNQRRAEDPPFAVRVLPNAHVVGLGVATVGLRQAGGVRPQLFNDVQLFVTGLPSGRKAVHDRIVGLQVANLERMLLLVPPSGNSKEFAPLVAFQIAKGVHRAMNDDTGESLA